MLHSRHQSLPISSHTLNPPCGKIWTEGRWCFLDNTTEKIAWHPAFVSGMELTLRNNKKDLVFQSNHELNKEPLRADLLVIEKNPGVEIQKSIADIFRTHNIWEYKGFGDELNIDTLSKSVN